eukprot:TRINITY_DN6051_c0_g1_i1.p1 TRINITY_DN6051_c0_g1~~TRINITY_DN6051_c0_g1_i1.p1  ORF type:complete len:347 (+),score=115.50 TRINITY_DN6051_c0_g1_i1:69-1109(+)
MLLAISPNRPVRGGGKAGRSMSDTSPRRSGRRRLSFAELARSKSESQPGAFAETQEEGDLCNMVVRARDMLVDSALGSTIGWLACHTGTHPAVVRACIHEEIKHTTNPCLLLREDSVCVRTISTCCDLAGEGYLKYILPRIIKTLNRSRTSLEIDPLKEPDEAQVAKNKEELIEVFTKALDKIWASARKISLPMRVMMKEIHEEVQNSFKNKQCPSDPAKIALSSSFFLRFLIPSVVNPRPILKKVKISPPLQRKLILLSKVLVCIANETLPHGKEEFMAEVVGSLVRSCRALEDFYRDMVSVVRRRFLCAPMYFCLFFVGTRNVCECSCLFVDLHAIRCAARGLT